jgi:predicted transcriptional regulator
MNFDSFLSSPRWEILQIIAKSPSSPTEIAGKLGTTIAYVSQQLKLLDAAGLIFKTKTGASEKGKPRSVFETEKDLIYIAALTKNFSEKKLISSQDYHQDILKIWLLEDSSFHPYFEKLYWELEGNKKEIEFLFLDIKSPRFIVVTDSKTLKSKIENFISKLDKKLGCSFVSSFPEEKEFVVKLNGFKEEEK